MMNYILIMIDNLIIYKYTGEFDTELNNSADRALLQFFISVFTLCLPFYFNRTTRRKNLNKTYRQVPGSLSTKAPPGTAPLH